MKIPRSVYIHVPFCSHRCGYCNFTLVAGRDDLIGVYTQALEREIADSILTPQPVETIFLGGGTPTHLAPQMLSKLLDIVTKWFIPTADAEFSCEANPLDCTPERLQLLRDAGVNRLSLGGQSFSDRKLRVLERDHCGEELQETLDRCAQDFFNLSLDLIFAAPEETLAEWQQDVRRALRSPIQHLSTYGLTIERGSAFYGRTLRQALTELDAETQLAMYEFVISEAKQAGWQHYEVSNFARPGMHCRHNQAYWLGNPWWGFGPGAASFLSREEPAVSQGEPTMVRAVNHQSTTNYIRRVLAGESAIAESVVLPLEEIVRERLVFGLRQLAGVALSELDELYGSPVRELFEPSLTEFIERGMLETSGDRLRLTHSGLMISDSLWPSLLG